MTDAPRMGLGAVLAKLLDTALGRRAIDHLYAAAHSEKRAERRILYARLCGWRVGR